MPAASSRHEPSWPPLCTSVGIEQQHAVLVDEHAEQSTGWRLDIQLRQWQKLAFAKWVNGQQGVVSVVTGGGKTIFAEFCILHFRKIHPSGRVLIVVPTISLLDQWYVSLLEDLHVAEKDIGCYSGEERCDQSRPINSAAPIASLAVRSFYSSRPAYSAPRVGS